MLPMLDPFPDDGAIRFRKHRDVGSVLNATLVFIRQNARELLTSYLAIVAPIAAASALASVLFLSRSGDLLSDPQAILNDPGAIFGPSYLISVVLGVLTTVVAQAAAGGYVRLYRRGEAGAITPSVLWDETRDLILPLLGLTLAVFAGIVVTALVNIVPCLGSLAWVAFLVWVFPTVSVTVAVRVLEAPSLRQAWDRARVLVKGSWGFAAGALLLAGVVLVLFSVAVGVVTGLAGVLLGAGAGFDPFDAPTQITTGMAVLQTVTGVLSYAIYLIAFLAVYFVHGRLAEDLDGTSLGDDLDVLEAEVLGSGREPGALSFDADRPASTRPLDPPPAGLPPRPPAPPADGDERPDDEARGGFRGGGFGSAA